jgi:hypothetical protein
VIYVQKKLSSFDIFTEEKPYDITPNSFVFAKAVDEFGEDGIPCVTESKDVFATTNSTTPN